MASKSVKRPGEDLPDGAEATGPLQPTLHPNPTHRLDVARVGPALGTRHRRATNRLHGGDNTELQEESSGAVATHCGHGSVFEVSAPGVCSREDGVPSVWRYRDGAGFPL